MLGTGVKPATRFGARLACGRGQPSKEWVGAAVVCTLNVQKLSYRTECKLKEWLLIGKFAAAGRVHEWATGAEVRSVEKSLVTGRGMLRGTELQRSVEKGLVTGRRMLRATALQRSGEDGAAGGRRMQKWVWLLLTSESALAGSARLGWCCTVQAERVCVLAPCPV